MSYFRCNWFDKYLMKISEVIKPLKLYAATISLHTSNDTITVKTENAAQADARNTLQC